MLDSRSSFVGQTEARPLPPLQNSLASGGVIAAPLEEEESDEDEENGGKQAEVEFAGHTRGDQG